MKLPLVKTVLLLATGLLTNCQSDSKPVQAPPSPSLPQTEVKDSFEKVVVMVDRFETKTLDVTGDKIPDVPHGLLVQGSLEESCQHLGITPKVIPLDNDSNRDGYTDASEFLKVVQNLAAIVKKQKVSAVCISMGIEVSVIDLKKSGIHDYQSLLKNHRKAVEVFSIVPPNETPEGKNDREKTLASFKDYLKSFQLLAAIAKDTPIFIGGSNDASSISFLPFIPNVYSVSNPNGQQKFIKYQATKDQCTVLLRVEGSQVYLSNSNRVLTTLDSPQSRPYTLPFIGSSFGTPYIVAMFLAGKLQVVPNAPTFKPLKKPASGK
jgi:hypothetical protein